MIGGLSPPQVIIVHAWQVVMNEAHGVNHFQCDRGRHGLFLTVLWRKHFRRGNAQDGPNAFATGH
jgi:hypothetical protein